MSGETQFNSISGYSLGNTYAIIIDPIGNVYANNLSVTGNSNFGSGTMSGNGYGLNNINETLGRNDYARLRFGVGNDFPKGRQVDYVLGKWTTEQSLMLHERIDKGIEIIKSFGTIGLQLTMTNYNNK